MFLRLGLSEILDFAGDEDLTGLAVICLFITLGALSLDVCNRSVICFTFPFCLFVDFSILSYCYFGSTFYTLTLIFCPIGGFLTGSIGFVGD